MYLKRSVGPRQVTLPDGSVLTRADLPAANTRRWVASRKMVVVRAVQFGLISQEEAMELYGLSEEELTSWRVSAEQHGENALKATAVQRFRHF